MKRLHLAVLSTTSLLLFLTLPAPPDDTGSRPAALARLLPASASAEPAPAPAPAPGIHRQFELMGQQALVVVRDLPKERADEIIGYAVDEMERFVALADPDGSEEGGVGQLNAAAGAGPMVIDHRLAALLRRALDFCSWSDGAFGPLGGHLNRIWGLYQSGVASAPPPQEVSAAINTTACDLLWVDPKEPSAQLAGGARVDLWSFAAGHAVDLAIATLQEEGADNALVELGSVARGLGEGPGGDGWWLIMPELAEMSELVANIPLKDRAVAVARPEVRPVSVAGEPSTPYLHHRTGRPAQGVLAVLAATELAADAQALAATMFVTGSRNGQLRLGNLRPAPSVLWITGSRSRPLLVDHRWAEIRR